MWVIWTILSVNCGSKVSITVIFCLPATIPARKPLRQHDITGQQKRNHSTDERHIGSKSVSRYFSFASSHDTLRASIHPSIQSSHPTKHVNGDWVGVWVNTDNGPTVSRVTNRHESSTPLYGHWLSVHCLFSLTQVCAKRLR